jgi:hypothetical protein
VAVFHVAHFVAFDECEELLLVQLLQRADDPGDFAVVDGALLGLLPLPM